MVKLKHGVSFGKYLFLNMLSLKQGQKGPDLGAVGGRILRWRQDFDPQGYTPYINPSPRVGCVNMVGTFRVA